jgi:FlaA1/EpsC-like NDP-sugar epimerase
MSLNTLGQRVLSVPRPAKRLLALVADAVICVFSVWVAFGLRLDDWGALSGAKWIPVLVSLGIGIPLFVVTGFYRAIFRYAGWTALMTVGKVMVGYGALYATIFTLIRVNGVPRTIGIIQPLLLLLLVGGVRIGVRFWLGGLYQQHLKQERLPRVLIYGAGSAGRQLAAVLTNSREMVSVGFVDDDATLQGNTINGIMVFGPDRVHAAIERLQVTDVLLAMPSASRVRRNEILAWLQQLPVRVRTLPGLMDLAYGRVQLSDLRDLDIEDLLARDSVIPNGILLNKDIRGKVVLVTGAGGSIGSELCRQILAAAPSVLLLVEVTEYALYAIHQELEAKLRNREVDNVKLVPLFASVCDDRRMTKIMQTWHPHTVYHAAAYKHVPLVEHNPVEGIRNNVIGTLTTAQAAAGQGVESFVLISTDKAVRPTNIMGASKRLAEMVLQAMSGGNTTDTRFSMVRFGNVLGSSGSVVPKFRQQIKEGGPITLTHTAITRYFMTIPEAAQLVIQAGAMANGGDVYVLDMGQPVRIIDLARRMVELSGLKVRDEVCPDGDIEIVITGLRPGEKLFEELLIGENPEPTQHQRIMKAHEECLPWDRLKCELTELSVALDGNDVSALRAILQRLVSGYQPSGDIVDWVHLEGVDAARNLHASGGALHRRD